MADRRLLWTGIAGPLVFLATVIAGGLAEPGYSHVGRAVSELAQRGAPNAFAVSVGFAISAVLCGVLGVGIVRQAGAGEPRLRRTGWLLVAYAVAAFLCGTIFPMDPFGAELTFRGLMHIVLVAASAFILIGALALGGVALRARAPWFPAYSRASIAAMLAGGALSAVAGAYGISVLGAAERLTQASYLLWIAVFAILLLRRDSRTLPPGPQRA